MRRPLELRTGHRPFQLTVMVSGVISGVTGLAFPRARSSVIEQVFPSWLLFSWYGSLLVWCGLVLSVTIQPDHVRYTADSLRTRMLLESAGLWGMGGSCAAYGAAVLSYSGIRSLTASLFVGLFAGAAIWRAWEIRTDLRKLSLALADPKRAEPPPLADPQEGP